MTNEPNSPEPANVPEPLPPLEAASPPSAPADEPAAERPKAYRAPAKDPLAQIADAIREITPVLDAADMEPDPTREDWGRSRGQIDAAHALYKGEILSVIDEALRSLPTGNELRVKVAANVAWIGAELAALLWASKRVDDAQRLLLQIVKVAPSAAPDGANVKAELEGALADTAAWVELTRARYLQRSRQWEEGDRVLRSARGKATHPVIKAAIAKQLGGARPLTGGPPPLFRINGCGASIYGERDRRADGSYVTTYCVALLFIPVWPISAYRVIDHGNGSYGFMAKEPLSAFARGYRWVLAGLVGVWIAGAMFTGWLNDPRRLAANAFEETRTEVASMEPAAALAAWERLANEHGYSLSSEARERTGSELVRLSLDEVPTPMTAARAGEVETAIARFRALPELAHGPAQDRLLAERVLAWQSDVGSASREDALASMRILDALETASAPTPVSPELAEVEALLASQGLGSALGGSRGGSAPVPEIAERRADLHRVIGEQLASEWPLEAVEHWVAAGDPTSIERAGTTLAELAPSRSLLLEIERPVSGYLAATSAGAEPRDTVALALDAARAMQADEGRRLALESGDERALRAVLTTYPGDQETIAALAQAKRQAGDLPGAHALLDPLGAPGRLAGPAQLARANVLADEGELAGAASLLAHYVDARLPAFQSAQRAYQSAFDARTASLEAQLRSPYPPRELEARLTGVTDDEEGRGIVQAWFLEQVSGDANLTALRADLDARSGVVPSILALAMLELRLGNDTAGEARDGHFREAERLFLAIRQQAEGLPSFHLGLGQVYHRLGRAAEGDAEIAEVLAMGDPMLELEAAHTYRELGINSRASELATSAYDRGVQPAAGGAAVLMSLLATTLEDEELWLGRADQSSPFVQVNLLQARARRTARDGDLRQAERLFGQVADRHLAMGEHDTASLNNAAIATQQRYECSGNPAHLARAVDLMEQALRRSPESGLTASNLADLLAYSGRIAVLERFVRTRELHLDARSAEEMVEWLLQGSQHDAVVAAMREDASLRRTVEVSRQAQALSPQRTDAYEGELTILEALGDDAGLAQLRERLTRVPNLETSVTAEQAARFQRGELDETVLASLESAITTRRARVEALRGGHGPTFAAAAVMLGSSLTERAQVRRDAALFEEAVSILREAEAAAPGLGTASPLAWALAGRGLLELSVASAPAREIVETGWRSAPFGVLAARLHADAAAAPAASSSASLREAASSLHGLRDQGVQASALARLVGDAELLASAHAEAATEGARTAFAIRVALAPWAPYAELAPLLE